MMTTETKKWAIGETYYSAHGEMHGRPWDLGSLGNECETEAEADENASIWMSGLTKNELKYATTYVTRFRVIALDEDGSIGYAESY